MMIVCGWDNTTEAKVGYQAIPMQCEACSLKSTKNLSEILNVRLNFVGEDDAIMNIIVYAIFTIGDNFA